MKLTWTRPLEVKKHPPDCMWILIATARRDVTPGEELTIDRNEAAGSHYGLYHETAESLLLLSTMFPREVHSCKCNEEDGVCFAGRLYITQGLTPK